ncbi:DUF3105 domain-containing protein [Haloglycomyces albus]|uniref:DUF3105 domain-containing protein n=1 Tax=Haloglycomyces albus TaxID=526067 RepID=UPI00146FB161|nr:DUF3105 domain-containing protein [Haloglycomyces albus]
MSESKRTRSPKVTVKNPKPWGLIVTFSIIGVVALGIVGGALWVVNDSKKPPEGLESFLGDYEYSTELRLAMEDGEIEADDLEHPQVAERTHVEEGTYVDYDTEPAVGGNHYGQWQNCQGTVYDGAIDTRNAIHALEHGAVWITYDPDAVSDSDVEELASNVQGRDYTFMSQYPGMDQPISLQAWGLRLTVDNPEDERISQFIDRFAQAKDNTMEPNATCSGGVTTTVDDPMPEPPSEDEDSDHDETSETSDDNAKDQEE